MKKLYLLPLLGLLFTGCDNNDAETLPTLSDKTYEGLAELNLVYDGAPMVGKSAALSGDVLTFDSKVDLGSYSEALKMLPPIPGPGVLPGSPTLPLHLSFAPNKDKYSVAGSGETDFVTYSYLGSLTENLVDFQFYNVKLKDTRFAGRVWKPTPANSETGASPFHIVWETSQPGLLENFDGSIEDALKLLANLPLIPAYNNTAYMSATQLITSGVTALSFNPDGNLVVTYLQSANGAAQFAQAPLCMVQYLPQGDNTVKLYVNPTDLVSVILMNNTNKPDIPSNPFGKSVSRADAEPAEGSLLDLFTPEELGLILSNAAPMLSQGIPMQYTMDAKSMELYLPTEILLPLVKNVIAPMLAKPEVQEMIIARVENIASLQPYLPLVKGMLLALPLILETTTKAELGLSLTSM
ncbi:MAG: hypothetical protein K2K97_01235 [Muribaculaceae bacterium]|nr:hypothetical protein [Muribaculaceae bacterium]